jgi:glycine/D-amino acid oxidase-like deaminating enzyme
VPQSPDSCDVAIVGGGVHGASAAYHLAGHGYKIILLERSYPAEGPTGLSTAVCRAYYTNQFLAEVAGESLRFLADFGAHTGGDSGFRRCGAVYLHPPADQADVERTVGRLRGRGHDFTLIDADGVRAHLPGADVTGVGPAVWEADAGYADPVATTKSLLDHAVSRGVQCRMRAQVVRLRQRSVSWSLALADGSEITASRVLVAAGPWSRPLLWTAGIDLPLTAQRHVVATVAHPGGLPCVVADLVGGVYLKPEAEAVCIGGLQATPDVSPENPVPGITDAEGERLLAPAAARLPWLASADYTGGWASLYDISPDWQPVIGEVADGLFVDAGTSGHGFKLAPVLGYHVTRLVTGEKPDPRLGQFHPARFARGTYLEAGFGDARILA